MAQTHWLDNIQVDPVSAFQHACESNDTYNYLARVNGEVWIGSSPELFLKSDYQTSETVALAGTRLRTNQDEVWGDKEVQEQSIVGTYLLDTFNQMGFLRQQLGSHSPKPLGIFNTFVTSLLPQTRVIQIG